MSRTREGRDKEANETARQQAGSQPVTETGGQPTASRPSSYASGRESMREFPRRSTSLRDRNISESRDIYDRGYPREGRSYDRESQRDQMYRSDYGDRTQSPTYYAGYYRQRTVYGTLGRDAESNYETRGNQFGRDEDRSRYDRSNIGRGRISEDYDYDRERRRQRSSREEYGEPRYRETFSGRYGQQQWPSRRGEERGQGVDYSAEPYYRGEDWRERRDAYSGQNYLRCRDIMTKDVTTCSPQTSIREVAEKMQDENVGSLPVVENGRLIGIVTDRDIVCRVLAEGRDSRTAMVADAMSEDLVTCTPEETVLDAIRKMGEHQIRRIPVCDINGRLRGIIAMADVALEAERDRELAQALEEISQPLPNRSRRM